ncbi:MAG: hypothetical protein HYX32_07340 [Actinobacteria bacterium]|nr:hypothetical protein [Actinomycetota bacterium]
MRSGTADVREALSIVGSRGQDVTAAVLDSDNAALELARRTVVEVGVDAVVETLGANVPTKGTGV